MAKTVGNLFERVVSYDNLYAAYLDARKGKRQQAEVARFSANLEENLLNIHNHLVWGGDQVPHAALGFLSLSNATFRHLRLRIELSIMP